ncbi:hypothetical protein [Reichenbachiella ulvae]|uniref:Uncharacterized protein n=1 Tax=Reichenbachiella ulvae TaxID=2980104 RepID=A0ABT3D106_9BACT|nr:hypothetical protein [Reichenbachiella ulvae]MCV9389514.1 hypothetical protein [Reichenbachiella ulvae]
MNKDRLLSLDVFRGLTIAAMILVNDLARGRMYMLRYCMHSGMAVRLQI